MSILNRSNLKTKNGLPYLEIPEIANVEWIQHAFLTRKGGISPPPFDSLNLSISTGDSGEHISQNRKLIAVSFGFDSDHLILLRQNHQDRILVMREPDDTLPHNLEYDAVITNSAKRFLGIKTADCLPVLVLDKTKKVIAAIHAGRQGTAHKITSKTLKRMRAEFGCLPKDLWVALGPSIGPCCYEIDEKVFLQEWEPFSTPNEEGKWMVDLPRINIAEIKREGIREEQIFWIDLCTCCHPNILFSSRGEGRTGRQLSFIGITK